MGRQTPSHAGSTILYEGYIAATPAARLVCQSKQPKEDTKACDLGIYVQVGFHFHRTNIGVGIASQPDINIICTIRRGVHTSKMNMYYIVHLLNAFYIYYVMICPALVTVQTNSVAEAFIRSIIGKHVAGCSTQ